ncbi:hypothetical protein D1AOALGA4SA_10315 [Olavius algarvensis Delta 1 endosymbiont]|nr:hypothetical protein D1AOALGA4SA_10315 [Olavius algarvensis Delta 1 endosymbiont]
MRIFTFMRPLYNLNHTTSLPGRIPCYLPFAPCPPPSLLSSSLFCVQKSYNSPFRIPTLPRLSSSKAKFICPLPQAPGPLPRASRPPRSALSPLPHILYSSP